VKRTPAIEEEANFLDKLCEGELSLTHLSKADLERLTGIIDGLETKVKHVSQDVAARIQLMMAQLQMVMHALSKTVESTTRGNESLVRNMIAR